MPDFQENVVIGNAALRLKRTQKNDGGWQWDNPDTDPASGEPTPTNTIGVTALGFLDAYRNLNNLAVVSTYATLEQVCCAAYEKMVASAADPDPSKHRIRGPDIRYLVRLAEIVNDSQYVDFGKTRWASAKTEFGSGTATGFAEFIRAARKGQSLFGLIPWDINLYIISLNALHGYEPGGGWDAEAVEMAEVVYASAYDQPPDFDMSDHNQAEYWLGVSGVLDALITTKIHSDKWLALYNALAGGQQQDGHWPGILGGSDIQTTAYCGVALLKAYIEMYATGYPYPPAKMPAKVLDALEYVAGQQLENGGFEYSTGVENTEVTSEAVQFFNRVPD